MLNGVGRFGLVSRLLHWGMAAGILVMLGLGTYIANMTVSLSNFWLFGLHKSIGVTLLALVLVRLVWHRITPPPPSLTDGIASWQLAASRWVHRALYLLMGLVPLTGWVGSGASGLPVQVYGGLSLPPLAPVSKPLETAAFATHHALTILLGLLVVAHVGGALHRHLVRRDRTLVRMVRGERRGT